MKMKDMFKKVETYNEIAEIMLTQKAKIIFGEKWYHEEFKNYDDFKKYVRHEYIKEVADKILNSEDWEIDGTLEIPWSDGTSTYFAEIVSTY